MTSTTPSSDDPARSLAAFLAWVVDVRIIDGAVNGTAQLAKATGSAARKLQTGYVRNYALGIALGMALIIGFMLSRTWWAHETPRLPFPHAAHAPARHRRGRCSACSASTAS